MIFIKNMAAPMRRYIQYVIRIFLFIMIFITISGENILIFAQSIQQQKETDILGNEIEWEYEGISFDDNAVEEVPYSSEVPTETNAENKQNSATAYNTRPEASNMQPYSNTVNTSDAGNRKYIFYLLIVSVLVILIGAIIIKFVL